MNTPTQTLRVVFTLSALACSVVLVLFVRGRAEWTDAFWLQLAAASGAHVIGVISDESKRDYVLGLGAKGVINRKDFKCWGQMPTVNSPEYKEWLTEARKFGKAIWDITGKGVNVDMVFEHPGEATFPVSVFVVKRGAKTWPVEVR